MPGGLAGLDTGLPARGGDTQRQLAALYDYLAMLLENLRYILGNLSPENFNETEVSEWIGKTVKAESVVSQTLITNELYSDYGAIADLVVDELRTDYAKAARCLAGNTAPLDYLHIRDEQIDFLTGTVKTVNGEPLTEQLCHRGRCFWWTDAGRTQMTSQAATAWPVTVYQYDELLKGTLRFEQLTRDGATIKVPVLILGAGTGDQQDPNIGKAYLRKDADSLDIYLHGSADNGVFIGQYTDIVGLRKPTRLDFSGWGDGTQNGSFTETLDGNVTRRFGVTFDADGRPVKLTDDAGHETAVVWECS